jgi:2-methylfumaryl-CoA hydratase
MVRKRDEAAPVPGDHVPRLPDAVLPSTLGDACPRIDVAAYDFTLAGSPSRFGDYAVGEKIDHVDGITVEEAEHQIATRLYQNTRAFISISIPRRRAGSNAGSSTAAM